MHYSGFYQASFKLFPFMLLLHMVQYCKYLQSTCITPRQVVVDVFYLLCHKSSRVVLSISRFKNHNLSMHRPAPEIQLHKTTEKVVQPKVTTKVIAKEKETLVATLDGIGQQSIHNLNLIICLSEMGGEVPRFIPAGLK